MHLVNCYRNSIRMSKAAKPIVEQNFTDFWQFSAPYRFCTAFVEQWASLKTQAFAPFERADSRVGSALFWTSPHTPPTRHDKAGNSGMEGISNRGRTPLRVKDQAFIEPISISSPSNAIPCLRISKASAPA